MLFSPEDFTKQILQIPHRKRFDIWRNRLSDDEYQAIIDKFRELTIDKDVITPSWIPGDDWSETVYEPIYTKSCNYDEEQSGLCFGLFFWVYFMNHCDDERWSFTRAKKDDNDIIGLTYFRIE
jgi:hypothetical protein